MSDAITPKPKETPTAFEARKAYILMGAERSTSKVAQSLGKSKTMIDRLCGRWGWVADAQAYDAQVAKAEADAVIKERAKMAQRKERARVTLNDKELRGASALESKAYELLKLSPVTRKLNDKDGTTILTPAHANEFRAAAQLLITASDLRRRALGLPKETLAAQVAAWSDQQLMAYIVMTLSGGIDATQTLMPYEPSQLESTATSALSTSLAGGAAAGVESPDDQHGPAAGTS